VSGEFAFQERREVGVGRRRRGGGNARLDEN